MSDTTTETPTEQAVAKNEEKPAVKMRRFLEDQAQDIAMIAPAQMDVTTFIALATDTLARDELLLNAARNNPVAFVGAVMKAARLGLEPGTEEFYFTPRKKNGKWEILGIVGYQGIVKMIYNAGAVSSVIVEVVRANDRFEYAPGRDARPVHEVDWWTDRGDMVGVYAYAVMKDGATSKVVVLNAAAIEKYRAASDSAKSEYSPWNKWPEPMWMKTAARQLGKWIPTSAEKVVDGHPSRPRIDVTNEDFDDDRVAVIDGEVVNTATGEVTS